MSKKTYTIEDWHNPEPLCEPFCVIEDHFDDDDGEYTGSTLYACDGDDGRMVISACSEGSILSLRLHECEFIGECDLLIDDVLGWFDDLLFHVGEMKQAPRGMR